MKESLAKRPLIFGEVLFDHFPDGSAVLGGAPFNVAWHLAAFGLKPLFISRIGDDALGWKVEAAMQSWGMECGGLQKDSLHATGTVEVQFKDGEPAYDIVDNVAYDFIDSALLPKLEGEWLLYHGSLALRHQQSVTALEHLKQHCAARLFVDVNLRPPWWKRETILKLLDGAAWVKLNSDELVQIYPDLAGNDSRIGALRKKISAQILLTAGEQGATAIDSHDNSRIAIAPEAGATVMDTVGAGDAFCSVLLAGQLLEWPLQLSMQRAQVFASAIVGLRGATTRDRAFYRHFRQQWGIKE